MLDTADALNVCHGPCQLCLVALCSHRRLDSTGRNPPRCIPPFLLWSICGQETKCVFSAIALNQAHEQCNALVKGAGGVVGLTNNPGALRQRMIPGSEIS